MKFIDGYKSYIGGAFMAVGAFLVAIGEAELGGIMNTFGTALLGVGIAHKIDKAS